MSASNNLTDFLTSIANTLRTAHGTTDKINPQNFQTLISALASTGGTTSNKLPSLIDRSISRITANDLKNVSTIGQSAFRDCSNLTSVTIPDNVTTISYDAFSGCFRLRTVDMSAASSLTTISDRAFYGCSSLDSLEIPESVTVIGANALNCGATEFTFLSPTPPRINSNTFDINNINVIYVPSIDNYASAPNWSALSGYMEEV